MSDEPTADSPQPADEQDQPAPERPAEDGPGTATSDEPEGGSAD
jgi:hypothetical protein